ncbi:unannotated protein [freshwater metagenome]|uniref:Unannotated protein n=1 Tax=freshwater metagenome TaxID=449393 RepID=A0A6J6GYN4_9ZZZZ
MAKLTPRTLNAGIATIMPTAMATNPPIKMGKGKGMCGITVM